MYNKERVLAARIWRSLEGLDNLPSGIECLSVVFEAFSNKEALCSKNTSKYRENEEKCYQNELRIKCLINLRKAMFQNFEIFYKQSGEIICLICK